MKGMRSDHESTELDRIPKNVSVSPAIAQDEPDHAEERYTEDADDSTEESGKGPRKRKGATVEDAVSLYLKEISRTPLLTHDEEKTLAAQVERG